MLYARSKVSAVDPVFVSVENSEMEETFRQYDKVGLFVTAETIIAEEGAHRTLCILGNEDGREIVHVALAPGEKLELQAIYAGNGAPEEIQMGRILVHGHGEDPRAVHIVARELLNDDDARAGFLTPIQLVCGLRSGSMTEQDLLDAKMSDEQVQAMIGTDASSES